MDAIHAFFMKLIKRSIIIFYNTEKWAKQYEKKMGYKLVGSAE